jgi:hypothetical protein
MQSASGNDMIDIIMSCLRMVFEKLARESMPGDLYGLPLSLMLELAELPPKL